MLGMKMSRTVRRPLASLAVGLAAAALACAPQPVSNASPNSREVSAVNKDARAGAAGTNAAGATPSAPQQADAARMQGVDFAPRLSVVERGGQKRLRVEYTLTNRTGRPLLVFNQGDTQNPGPDGAVYVEPRADGVVEISQRGWEPPAEPSPAEVVYPGALLLAPGASASKELELTLDYLVARRPYRTVAPGVEMPRPVRRARFCVGVVPAEGVETRHEGEGARRILIPDYKGVVNQRLLCSPVLEIE
jgi:hypothetical protein